jgi:hypothetical protein
MLQARVGQDSCGSWRAVRMAPCWRPDPARRRPKPSHAAARWSCAQRSPSCRDQQSRLCRHWLRLRPTGEIRRPDNRARPPLLAPMEHSRSYLMDGCGVMASGRARPPTIITPTPAPSSCRRKQASPGANDEALRSYIGSSIGSVPPRSLLAPIADIEGSFAIWYAKSSRATCSPATWERYDAARRRVLLRCCAVCCGG